MTEFIAGTCEADETETWVCECVGRQMTVHVMECSECGHTYEHVNGDYEYCPRCGRKKKDVLELPSKLRTKDGI